MAASDHFWGNGNGEDPPVGCIDPVARKGVRTALLETKRVSDGLFEMHGTVAGVETRLTERIAVLADALGVGDIRKRFRKADENRAREQAQALASIPPMREKTPSELDRLESAARDFREGMERISSHDPLPAPKSDPPEDAAKKVGLGLVLIVFKTARDLAFEHGVRIAWGVALTSGGGLLVHYLHVWHILK